MAKLKSSKKSHRSSENKAVVNRKYKEAFRDASKAVVAAIKAGDNAKAKKLLPKAFSTIDKAAKRKVIHKNTAARNKAKIAKLLGKTK